MFEYKLLAPEDFELKYPNFVRLKEIPTYYERVKLENESWCTVKDERTKDVLVNKYGFQVVSLKDLTPLPPTREEALKMLQNKSVIGVKQKTVNKDNISQLIDIAMQDEKKDFQYEELNIDLSAIGDLSMTINKEYCKICGKGFKTVNRSHVGKHDIDWEEYEALPVMIPNVGMKIFWGSEDLQKSFPEPMNLLCSSGDFANYLDWLKLEGSRKYQEIAEYFNMPFPRKGPSIRTWEYCKKCGSPFDFGTDHYKSHGMTAKEYASLSRYIPDVGMDLFYKFADLRRAFPNPMQRGKGYGPFSDYLEWLKIDGVRKHTSIRKYFTGKG